MSIMVVIYLVRVSILNRLHGNTRMSSVEIECIGQVTRDQPVS